MRFLEKIIWSESELNRTTNTDTNGRLTQLKKRVTGKRTWKNSSGTSGQYQQMQKHANEKTKKLKKMYGLHLFV